MWLFLIVTILLPISSAYAEILDKVRLASPIDFWVPTIIISCLGVFACWYRGWLAAFTLPAALITPLAFLVQIHERGMFRAFRYEAGLYYVLQPYFGIMLVLGAHTLGIYLYLRRGKKLEDPHE